MKLKLTCLIALTTSLFVVGLHAEAFRTDINPALIYGRAFLAAPELSKEDKDYLFGGYWGGEKLPERFNKLISEYDNQFALVGEAARSTVPCDWGIDMSQGPATLLPHLARVKAVVLTARLRVLWHLQNGRQDQARDELLAAFALARNASRDGTLIATLVQIACEAICCTAVAQNYGHFTPATLQQLMEGMEKLPARRTVADCMKNEKTFFLDWAEAKLVDLQRQFPGDDAKVMQAARKALGFDQAPEGETSLWERVSQAANGTSEGIIGLLRDQERLYERTSAFLSMPYPEYERQLKSFTDELERSSNPFVKETLPSIIKSRQREFRVLSYLDMVRAALEYKLNGETGLKSVRDPCGSGPFAFRRFSFEGVDRGFELSSAFNLGNDKAVVIFVEKDGPLFQVDGNFPGRALSKQGSPQ